MRSSSLLALLQTLPLAAVACAGSDEAPITDVNCVDDKCDSNAVVPGVAETRVFPRLTFNLPVQLLWGPNDKQRAYVVEHSGKVRSFDSSGDPSSADVVLDLTSKVKLNAPPHFEAGLNAIAFDPDFPHTAVMYVTYDAISPDDPNNPTRMRWRLSRFTSSDNGKTFGAGTEQVLIEMDKNADEHNAGMVGFGKDGFLYVSAGDGGPSFDKNSFGQNNFALYGKMLRIDVHATAADPTDPAKTAASFRFRQEAGGGKVLFDHDTTNNGKRTLPYGIPSDNPFANGQNGRPEIFATGLRNPWRWSFDKDGLIWAGDVGQDAFEEVNNITLGGNYGWGPREARHCAPGRNPCDVLGSTDPVVELQHGPNVNAVIGGFVYRGKDMPKLKGNYIFGNFTPGTIFGIFNENNKKAPEALGTMSHAISGFGEDPDGELYVLDLLKGGIYKLTAGPDHAAQGQAPPYKFLMRSGIGTEAGAKAYYKSIIPGYDENTGLVNGQPYTEQQWEHERGLDAQPTAAAFYQNSLDLGFWRDMVCTNQIARGVGGCRVRNWRNENERTGPPFTGNLGTVTMDVSPEGFTRFYVFGPDGTLSPFAVLDSEGKKFIPELCTTCHGGKYGGAGSSPDLGSIFREWEPRTDEFATAPPVPGFKAPVLIQESALTRDQINERWASLNDAAKLANSAIHRESEGAVVGTDHGVDATNAYIDALYTSRNPVVLAAQDSTAIMPASWQPRSGESAALSESKRQTWLTLAGRYCMGCHRANALDFADYANWQALSSTLGDRSVLEHYILDDPNDPTRNTTLYMPQAKLMFDRLQRDTEARGASHDWANQANSPSVPVCEISVEINGAAFTVPGQDLWITGNIDVLGNWTPPAGVPLTGTLINGQWTGVWRGKIVVPQGMAIQLKATILDAQGNLLQWEPDLPTGSRNREFRVPNSTAANLTGTWGRF
jgi:glucose/arabinose dehydrogenase/mono/diheme cytochrome c family protein